MFHVGFAEQPARSRRSNSSSCAPSQETRIMARTTVPTPHRRGALRPHMRMPTNASRRGQISFTETFASSSACAGRTMPLTAIFAGRGSLTPSSVPPPSKEGLYRVKRNESAVLVTWNVRSLCSRARSSLRLVARPTSDWAAFRVCSRHLRLHHLVVTFGARKHHGGKLRVACKTVAHNENLDLQGQWFALPLLAG